MRDDRGHRLSDGAVLDVFDWPVSLARMTSDGRPSTFAGVDRTISVLDEDGLKLIVGAAAAVSLTAASDPFGFPADLPCVGACCKGR